MTTLYRHYRPQTFADIAGQAHITDTLQSALAADRIAHAYLFHGPRGTGKTTTARVFAKRLVCTNPAAGEPCNTCELCVATQAGSNIDIIEIDAASNRRIDDIRLLQEGLQLKPTQGKRKIFIIDEVHMLTNEAFTALLKTLEEPIGHTLFILATTEFHRVPETIASRCQVYRFRRATAAEMTARLQSLLKQEKRTATTEALYYIGSRSDGCYRDAESLLGQLLTVSDAEITTESIIDFLGLPSPELIENFLSALVTSNAAAAIDVVDQAFSLGFDPEQFTQEVIRIARTAAISLAKGNPVPGIDMLPAASVKLPTIMRVLLQALQDLAYVPEPMIAIHLAILTLCESSPVTAAAPRAKQIATATLTAVPITIPTTPQPVTTVAMQANTAKPGIKKIDNVVDLATVQAVWPQLIIAVKGLNPVAATFLRAMEPVAVEGDLIKIAARYLLHSNFFIKPENRTIITTALTTLLGHEIRVVCHLAAGASKPTRPSSVKEREQQEANLVDAVKDIFG